MVMKIVITGAGGFIGSNLVEYHLNKGDEVCGIDNLSTGKFENIEKFIQNPKFKFIHDDIITWSEIERYMSLPERVYHMAAVVGMYKVIKEPERVLAVNIAGTERLLRAIRASNNKPQVLLASSAEVYGPISKQPLSEDDNIIIEAAAKNRFNYAISKLADEALGMSYYHKYKIPVVTARLFNTIGPKQTGQYGMVVPNFVKQAQHGDTITVFGDGNQTRSFCDIRDSVRMMDLLLNNKKSAGQVVNVGNNKEISINELAKLVKKVVNDSVNIEHISYLEAYGEDYVDIRRRQPALKKLFGLINYKHQWSLEDTVSSVIKYQTSCSRLKVNN